MVGALDWKTQPKKRDQVLSPLTNPQEQFDKPLSICWKKNVIIALKEDESAASDSCWPKVVAIGKTCEKGKILLTRKL